MVDADDLKSSGFMPCRFESCSGYPHHGPTLGASRALGERRRLVGVLVEDALSHGVCFQEILERVFIEQGDSRVTHLGLSDLQTVDFARCGEDLSKPKRLVRTTIENLQPQRIHDSLSAPEIETTHPDFFAAAASTAIAEFVGPGRFHDLRRITAEACRLQAFMVAGETVGRRARGIGQHRDPVGAVDSEANRKVNGEFGLTFVELMVPNLALGFWRGKNTSAAARTHGRIRLRAYNERGKAGTGPEENSAPVGGCPDRTTRGPCSA